MQIVATDNGRPQQESSTRVILEVVQRPTESLHPPSFLEQYKTTDVWENFAVGQMVALMRAEDPDGDRVWYSIIGEEDIPQIYFIPHGFSLDGDHTVSYVGVCLHESMHPSQMFGAFGL